MDPSCMSCKAPFDREFLIRVTNKSFMKNIYKKHRCELLFEHEKSRFPETMVDVSYIQDLREKIVTLSDENNEFQNEVNMKWSEAETACEYSNKSLKSIQDEILYLQVMESNILQEIDAVKRPYEDKVNELSDKMSQNNVIIGQSRWTITSYQNGEFINFLQNRDTKAKSYFVNPCSNGDCNGFLDENWKCNSCMNYSCNKCLEVIGSNNDEKHECNPDSVETAKLLKKETKPCPKCRTRIYKINGCDQMWCTCCHVAFSWNTGKVERGIVHNPHYYNFRRNGGAAVVRAPGDFVCGGMPEYRPMYENTRFVKDYLTRNSWSIGYLQNFVTYLNGLYQNQVTTMRRIRENVNEDVDNRDLRYNLLSNKINTDDFKKNLIRRDGTRFTEQTVLHVFELLSAVCTENYRYVNNSLQNLADKIKEGIGQEYLLSEEFSMFIQDTLMEIDENWDNIKKIMDYCNEQFERQSKTIGVSTYQISKDPLRLGRAIRHKW